MGRPLEYSHPSPTDSTQVLHLHCFLFWFIFTQTHLHFQVFSHQRKGRQGKTQDLEDHEVQPVSYLWAILIEEILWRSLSKISHKFLTWHDMSSKRKYPFLSKSHIISIISHNLHFHLDEINENIIFILWFSSTPFHVDTSSCLLIIIVFLFHSHPAYDA